MVGAGKTSENCKVEFDSDHVLSCVQIDEEELYSSVARGDAGYEEDSSKIDAANNSTFGGAEDSGAEALDGGPQSAAAKNAWGNAGAGVAAVKGVPR